MERLDLVLGGPADRLLADGLIDLEPLLQELRGHVVLVGGLMSRMWLLMRPVEGLAPRATADIDLGFDRRGLGLGASSRVVTPRLRDLGYEPSTVEETFLFVKDLGDGRVLPVDLLVARGASRADPPILEKGVTTVAVPGLAYALARGVRFVDLALLESGGPERRLEVPLPSLDAAFVLKATLAQAGVRMRPDRVSRDRVDALMLAAACLDDPDALVALGAPVNREGTQALAWLGDAFAGPSSAAAQTLGRHLLTEHAIPGGAEWSVQIAARLTEAVASGGRPG